MTKITDPHDLHDGLGPEIDDAQVRHLLRDHLTDEGREAFLTEMMLAIRNAKREGNLSYMNQVVDAWTRTVLVLNDAFEAKWERAQADAKNPDGESFTLEDARVRLGLV